MTSILIAIAGLFAVMADGSIALRIIATIAILFLLLTVNLYNAAARIGIIITPDSETFSEKTPNEEIRSQLGKAACRYHQIADYVCDLAKASLSLVSLSGVLICISLIMSIWSPIGCSNGFWTSHPVKSNGETALAPQIELLLLCVNRETTRQEIHSNSVSTIDADVDQSLVTAINKGFVAISLCKTNRYEYTYDLSETGLKMKAALEKRCAQKNDK